MQQWNVMIKMFGKCMFVGWVLAVTLAAGLAAAEDPDLVLYLPLNEAAGATTFSDASGNNNPGACTSPGCPTLGVAGKDGTAAQFDGIDDVITVADATSLRTNSFTISLWVQWNGVNTASVHFLTAKGVEHLELHTGGGAGVNGLRFIPAGSATIVDAANALSVGWNHVAATYDGSAAFVYVNGALVGSKTNITGGADLTSDTTPFQIGRRSDGTYPFSGVIDAVRVYRRVLSAAEIDDLAILFPPLPPSSFDAPGAPTTEAGHMLTLQELYDYLTTGATPGAAQAFQEPATGPAAGAMKTIQHIYAALKARFDLITVTAANVRSGKRFFSTSPWGIRTGAMPERPNVTGGNGLLTVSLPDGYYAGKTATAADTNLTVENIKSGVTLFGVAGTFTSGATATAADLLTGKTAFVNGTQIIGNVPAGSNVSGAEGVKTFIIPDGLYAGSKTATANDADLTTGNIRSGVTIFGVAGKTEVVDTTTATPTTAADLLTGKTAFVNGVQITGSVPAGSNVTGANGALSFTIPNGLYSGANTATAADANLTAANIKQGVTIFGVIGTSIQASGNATDGDVLTGKTYSNSSGSSSGAMPNRGAVTITPGTTAQTIPVGYHNGSGTVAGDPNLVASNIRLGVTIFGIQGTLRQPPIINKTGQTQCWDAERNLVSCDGTGQDGEYQMGIEPALMPTEGAYNTPTWTGARFTDNGDGTVIDTVTGLIWLKNANCFSYQSWAAALSAANTLASGTCGLIDGSHTGEWRLPNVNEQHSLIDATQSNPALPAGHPFTNVSTLTDYYWTSTTADPAYFNTSSTYLVGIHNGNIEVTIKWAGTQLLWPVRGGQ
ncbi:hypothetical protein U27_02219 [Candidatus Vecturithrix granuli]|uniref:LamG-like jellyroll fold domain-containing protein n=1 Tax=Vecturithrix granuli TaxID=1499967 RepID=A0A0S6WAR4_VECG1|nr:hypothetical protein U27_02219 [Candidatus Vecturithrix granuli]